MVSTCMQAHLRASTPRVRGLDRTLIARVGGDKEPEAAEDMHQVEDHRYHLEDLRARACTQAHEGRHQGLIRDLRARACNQAHEGTHQGLIRDLRARACNQAHEGTHQGLIRDLRARACNRGVLKDALRCVGHTEMSSRCIEVQSSGNQVAIKCTQVAISGTCKKPRSAPRLSSRVSMCCCSLSSLSSRSNRTRRRPRRSLRAAGLPD